MNFHFTGGLRLHGPLGAGDARVGPSQAEQGGLPHGGGAHGRHSHDQVQEELLLGREREGHRLLGEEITYFKIISLSNQNILLRN